MNPAYALAKLTTKSVQIDGTGFGGKRPDNLVIAGALAFKNPKTGKKIAKEVEALARYKYVFDDSCIKPLIDNMVLVFTESNLKPETLENLSRVAILNYKHVQLRFNKESRTHERYELKNAQLAALIGIERQSFTQTHRGLYDDMYHHLVSLDCLLSEHVNATMGD